MSMRFEHFSSLHQGPACLGERHAFGAQVNDEVDIIVLSCHEPENENGLIYVRSSQPK